LAVLICDFDGVLTNDLVHISDNGTESVMVSRSDGLAFKILKHLGWDIYILSSEKNKVVSKRCEKLGVSCVQGTFKKSDVVKKIGKENRIGLELMTYIGNDLNDFDAMKLCGVRFCPKNSHPMIKEIATQVSLKEGGDGVIRDFVERFLAVDVLEVLRSFE
jgi:YrbI family 3-deoxy-D-manno-octulosonate 8-phosphate phosphatase